MQHKTNDVWREQMGERWVVGTPDEAAKRVAELAATYDVDEVMLNPVAGAYADTPADRSPHRAVPLPDRV